MPIKKNGTKSSTFAFVLYNMNIDRFFLTYFGQRVMENELKKGDLKNAYKIYF